MIDANSATHVTFARPRTRKWSTPWCRRRCAFISSPEHSWKLDAEAEREALGIAGQVEAAGVEGSAELLNREPLGAIRGRCEADMDGIVGDRDDAR